MAFRLNAKMVLLTFPQLEPSFTKEEALRRLQEKSFGSKKLEQCMIALEHHADGSPHLHIATSWTGKLNLRSSDCFDFVTDKHGDYQGIKSWNSTLKYLTKEDPEPLTFGIPRQLLERLSRARNSAIPKTEQIARRLLSGESSQRILLDMPGFYMMNRKKIEDFEAVCATLKASSMKKPWHGLTTTSSDQPTQKLCEWVNSNACQPRAFRQRQLYLHGPPGSGKTTFLRLLNTSLRIFMMPPDEDYYDDYYDGKFDMIALDEFKAQKTQQQLNRWLDGQEMSVKKKGLQGYKRDNLPFIIISNYPPEDVYSKLFAFGQLGPFLSRLEVIKAEKIDLDNIKINEPPPEPQQQQQEQQSEEEPIGIDNNGSPIFEPMEESEEEEERGPELSRIGTGDLLRLYNLAK